MIALVVVVIIGMSITLLFVVPNVQNTNTNGSLGSIITGQEYYATTTPKGANNEDRLIRKGWGSLGSVVITKTGDDGAFLLLDATTSLALSDFATNTALLVDAPASLAAGTYVFDITYNKGLYLDVMGTGNGTTTITYR